jgi:hypothetical protein
LQQSQTPFVLTAIAESYSSGPYRAAAGKIAAGRLEAALPKMLQAAQPAEEEKIRRNFYRVAAELSDSKLNATESPKLFATEKKSPDIIVLLLEQAKHQQQTVSRIRPWQNHSLAEAALCCCRLHGVRGDHRAGSWEAETRTYSCCGGTARSFY